MLLANQNGWSLRVPSCSFTGEQSTFPGQERLDDLYQDRVGLSFKKIIILYYQLGIILKKKSEVKKNQSLIRGGR